MDDLYASLSSNVEHFDWGIAALIFIVYILVDAMWAYYTIAVTKRQPAKAATVGALMYFLLAFGVLNYVHNYLYIIPIALGSWIGTYLVVSRNPFAFRFFRRKH